MPTPAKTSNVDVVHAARALIEESGAEFSLADLAAAVGIRAPSLYKRFADRAAILRAVELDVIADLGGAVAQGLKRKSDAPLISAARAYRRFAKQHPESYAILFAPGAAEDDELQAARLKAVAPILTSLEDRIGPARALPAARTLTAFLHGFVSMELAGAFHLGGSVDAAFDEGVEAIARGLKL